MRRMVRSALVMLVLAASAVTGAVAGSPSPAGAEILWGDLLVDDEGGHVFQTYGDTVRIFDLAGTQVGTIPDQLGALDLVQRGRTMYVLAAGSPRINVVDLDTLAVTGGWSLGSLTHVGGIAYTAGHLWFTYGDQWSGGLGKLNVTTGVITAPLPTGLYAGGYIQATESPARVYVLDRGLSPSKIHKFDVSVDPIKEVSTSPHGNACGNGRELALSPDGGTAWTACGAPYKFNVFDTAILGEPANSYASTNYPNAIERSADGRFLVGGTQSVYGLDVWFYEVGNYTSLRSWEIGDAGLVPGMVAVSNGGTYVYATGADGVLRTYTMTPSITGVSPDHVLEGSATQVDVTGTNLADVTSATVGGVAATISPLTDTKLRVTVPASMTPGTQPVAVTSRWGTSPATAAAQVVVDPTKPDAPAAPTIQGVGVRSLTVAWTAPADHGYPITSYEVRAYLDGAASPFDTFTTTATSLEVGDLTSEQAYRFGVRAISSAGTGMESPRSDAGVAGNPDLGPFTSIAPFVAQQWKDLRGGTPAASWVADERAGIANGAQAPEDLVAKLRRSPDNVANVDPVVRLYRATFLRNPDAGGFDYWVAKRRKGAKVSQIGDTFAASSEFKRRYGTLGNQAFVKQLYRNVLGRAGDTSGVAYWTKQLDQHRKTRGQVIAGMSESSEYQRTQAAEVDVAVVNLAMLRRVPAQATFDAQVAALEGGGELSVLVRSLIDSATYDARFA